MSQDADDFEAKLAAIRLSYLKEGLPDQLKAIVACYDEFMASTDKSRNLLDALAPLHAAAHKLAGSSGTFGFPETAALARTLSDCTDKNGPGETVQPEDLIKNICSTVLELQKTVEEIETD